MLGSRHVVVFEKRRSLHEHRRRLAARLQLLVQRDEALLVDAPFADEHVLAGEIVQCADRRRAWSGDHHLTDVGARRLREGDQFLPLGV
jgi:hypothetical protein